MDLCIDQIYLQTLIPLRATSKTILISWLFLSHLRKYEHLYTLYAYRPLLAWITASLQCGMEAIRLWRCIGMVVALIAPSGHMPCWMWCLIFLLTTTHRFSMGLKVSGVSWETKNRNTIVIEAAFGTFVGRSQVFFQIRSSIQPVSRGKHEVL